MIPSDFARSPIRASVRARASRLQCTLRRGMTMIEATLALAVLSAVMISAYGAYRMSRGDLGANDLGTGVVQLATNVQNVFGANGAYASATAANINTTGLVPSAWRYDGTNVVDNRGNSVAFTTSASSFTIVLQNMSASDCAKAATQMAGAAYSVRVGAAATAAAGVISGGSAYKDTAGTISGANLATGCGEASRKIAVEIR